MSQLTNYGENQLVDKMRGTPPSYPTSWYAALGTAASDSGFTEITGTDLPRVAILRSLGKWAGTQGAGSVLASTGTSHVTSNNDIIQYGTAASARGTATHLGLFDALTGGNCWIWVPLPSSIVINMGDTPSIAAGLIQFSLGLTGGCSDYLANKLIDEAFRGQAYSWPANMYGALYTLAPTNAGGGTEASGGSYARCVLPSTMAALSGTQAPGSTSASSGTSGRTSNNAALAYPAPTVDLGDLVAEAFKDASTAGNLMFWKAFASPKTVSASPSPLSHAPDKCGFTFA
jgi:hypothetical protein